MTGGGGRSGIRFAAWPKSHTAGLSMRLVLVGVMLLVGIGAAADTQSCRVVAIADGDSLTCTFGGTRTEVRLDEIDAPEHDQPHGGQAKQSLAKLCLNKQVTLDRHGVDDYGRVLARVTCGGVDANESQVRRGMAWVYDHYVKDRSLYNDQTRARSEGLGLWAEPDPTPPWDWRHSRRGPAPAALVLQRSTSTRRGMAGGKDLIRRRRSRRTGSRMTALGSRRRTALGWMSVLTMAAASSVEHPTMCFDGSNHLANFHPSPRWRGSSRPDIPSPETVARQCRSGASGVRPGRRRESESRVTVQHLSGCARCFFVALYPALRRLEPTNARVGCSSRMAIEPPAR